MFFRRIIKKYRQIKREKFFKRFKKFGVANDVNLKAVFYYPERICIGSHIYIGPGAEINGLGGIEINDGTIIGPNFVVHSANHKFKDSKYIPYDEEFDFREVKIDENVWIGGNVIVVPGTHIGEGCIIGAGSVVSGVIPPLSIIVGNPCKIIKTRDREHYYRLKKEGKIYLKYKFERGLVPKIDK